MTGRAHWAAAAGSSGAAVMRPEDFPALPGGLLALSHALANPAQSLQTGHCSCSRSSITRQKQRSSV